MPKYPLVAFSGGVLVNLLGETNFWDYVRKKWNIPNLRKLYKEGRITRQELMDEYKYWREKGLTKNVLEDAIKKDLKLVKGVEEAFSALKAAKAATAVISGSADVLVKQLQKILRPDYVSYNEILFDKNNLPYSTKPTHPTPDIRMDKIDALRDFAKREGISMKQCAVIVHQKEDRDLCAVAGFSIAFNPLDDEIVEAVDETVESKDARDLLKLLL